MPSVASVANGTNEAYATRLAGMPSKTAARSGGRTTRSKANSRSRSQSGPRRKSVKRRRSRGSLSSGVLAAGWGVRTSWLMVARGAGRAARSVGRARDIEPGHRRDGVALALLGLAVVIAASSWFDAARPVGKWVDSLLRTLIGSAVLVLPVVALVVAVAVTAARPAPPWRQSRPRSPNTPVPGMMCVNFIIRKRSR